MRILHSADLHLDAPFAGRTAEEAEYLRRELLAVPGKLADICVSRRCDMVLLAGDLFDGAYSRESCRMLYAALERMAVPEFVSPGNHDHCGMESPWEREKWPENVHIFTKERMESVAVPELNCRVYGAGYTAMDCPGLLEGFRAVGEERCHVAVIHGDATQPRSPYCPVTAAQIRESGLDYLALGHIHQYGAFRSGGTVCGWPGCPMGRGWDETGEKGIYLVELGETTTVHFLPLRSPRFYEVQADSLAALENALPAAGSTDFYRVTLTGSGGEETGDFLGQFPNLELRDLRQQSGDLWRTADADTLEGTYFRMLREAMDAADEKTAAQIQLAAEISRKLLEGKEVALP